MLKIASATINPAARGVLNTLQAKVNSKSTYSEQVTYAKKQWDSKTSSQVKRAAFKHIRETLSALCIGPVRCAYCEDSLAEQIEHIRPKDFFPDICFDFDNYLYACGPCNRPKSNRYGRVVGNEVEEDVRRRNDPVLPPPTGPTALIDPRFEDPLSFFDLDLGGTMPDGTPVDATFQIFTRDGISLADAARSEFTIDVLKLNRDVLCEARRNAFGGFRSRLRDYVQQKLGGAPEIALARLRDDLMYTPHLTVFFEMRRQRQYHPDLDVLFEDAPEALNWPLTPL